MARLVPPSHTHGEAKEHIMSEATTSRIIRPGFSGPVARLEGVSFRYDPSEGDALHDIDLIVGRGDFLGVIGPSGAGKTTLAAVLSSAIPHHYSGTFSGRAVLCGQDSREVALTDVCRHVGSVLQDIDAQMVASNVEDEMLYGLENFGVPHDEIPSRIEAALEATDIAPLRTRDIDTLSGGQQQKVAIAAILALRPEVMVLDEPTAALDPASSRAVFDTLRRLNEEEGITVVVIEQKVALLSEYCRRVAVMSEGSIAHIGTPREVFAQSRSLRALGVDSPRVTRVSNKLLERGLVRDGHVCLTVEEARDLISSVVGCGKVVAAAADASRRGTGAEGACDATTTADAPILSFEDVSFSYGPGAASVDHISFEVHPGELLGIVGQNGAGKTTLTKLMSGLLKPSSGTVRVAGLDTSTARTSQVARYVSTLFQNPDHQICKNTVVEEVAFSLQLLGVGSEAALERARDTVEHFGLPSNADPFSLSRGQRQIVALASVVVTNPRLLILDEPTCGLDYRECMVVMDAVNATRERGCAVVMVCHDMEVVSDFATRLMVMAQGRQLADGDPRAIFADDNLLRRASIDAPQVSQLSSALGRDVSPAFAGITEVRDLVSAVEEMAGQGDRGARPLP